MATQDLQRCVWAFIVFVLACCCTLGIPIRRDVPDDVVYTDLHKTVELGSGVALKCQFHGTPLAVYWKKGDNPSTSPNLITWVEGEVDSGSCIQDKTCEMGDDFSLIIKNVSIADQGRYICRLSNNLGILRHNTTDVKVYASPDEPFPVIKECEENQGQNCTFPTLAAMNITCTSSRYFPRIDLFFLHGSQKFTTLKTWESTNSDGTKNKSIFTIAPPSKKPYVCVAFNIPGFHDQRTATVSFPGHSATNNTDSPDENDGPFQMRIVVPVAICGGVFLLCVFMLIVASCCIYFNRRRINHDNTAQEPAETTSLLQGHEDSTSKRGETAKVFDLVSSYELWHLVSYKKTEGHKRKLCKMLHQLSISDFKEDQLTPLAAYQSLCTWRDGKAEQLKALKKALEDVQYDEAWIYMFEKRNNTSMRVPEEIFKNILLQMGSTDDVNKFIRELIHGRNVISGGIDLVTETAMSDLTKWSKKQFGKNPFVLLSFALEKSGCKDEDIVHFWVPSELQTPPEETRVDTFINKLTGRHCRRLAVALKINDEQTEYFRLGNKFCLFDTRSMIAAFLDDKACSNYKKRCRLDDAVIKIGRYDLQDHFDTISYRQDVGFPVERPHPKHYQFDHESIFDDDIPQLVKLVRCLPHEKKKWFYKEIKLNRNDNADDEKTIKDKMKIWRDNIMTTLSKAKASKRFRSLSKELTNTDHSELALTDEEIENVAAHFNTPDKQVELMSKLHIEIDSDVQQNLSLEEQLKKMRNTPAKANCRDTLQKALKDSTLAQCIGSKSTTKHVTREELPRIALDLLMEDVRPIIKALELDQSTVEEKYRKEWDGEGSCTIDLVTKLLNSGVRGMGLLGTSELSRDDFCKALRKVGFIDVARSVYLGKYETKSQEGSTSVGDMPGERVETTVSREKKQILY